MTEPAAPSPNGGIPKGVVWAAVLLGIAAVVGALAVLLFVVMYFTVGEGNVDLAEAPASPPPIAAEAPGTPPGQPAAPGAAPEQPVAAAPPGAELVIEDWAGFADEAALQAAFDVNTAWTDNQLSLTPLPAAASPRGPAGIALAYAIQAPAVAENRGNDYVGFERDLPLPQDWRPYGRLATWVQTTDRSERQLVLQFHEATGEVWRHRLPLKDVPADGLVAIPLAPDQWEWADWSPAGNQRLDLDAIRRYGVFVGHSGPGAGELRLGTLAVQP